MYNEQQLTVKEIQRRMISLQSSVENFQSYLNKLYATSELSPDFASGVEATSAFLSLMTAALYVSQSEMSALYWTNVSTNLPSLKVHWLTAFESLSEWQMDNAPWQRHDDCEGCPE